MSNNDIAPSHLANPHHHLGDDEDGTDTSSESGDISTLEDSEDSCYNDRTTTYPHVAQPNVGNVCTCGIKRKKMNDPSKISRMNKRSPTDTRSHFRNPKHHRRDDTSKMTSSVLPEPNASPESNHSPTTDPRAARESIRGELSRPVIDQQIEGNSSNGPQDIGNITTKRTSAGGGGGVTQEIVGNRNEGEGQTIGNINDAFLGGGGDGGRGGGRGRGRDGVTQVIRRNTSGGVQRIGNINDGR